MSSSSKLKIPLQEIKSATDEFAEANVIGKGGYGIVYQGQSKQHGKLAIKRLNRVHSGQGEHEYGMEVTLLSKYRHENLVSLIGYCGEGEEKILVYKYEENQSLDKFLHSKDLSWIRRLHICLDAARGLRYLHSETGFEHGVIHRDIKSSNILLDENWRAKISDFGLSKIAVTNSADSVMFTVPCGTMGYVDPQILYGCGITQKSDVYSFGVVLYEVLFGKLVAIPEYVCDGHFTVQMAKKHYEEKTLQTMIDHDLSIEMNTNSLSTFSTIAYQCLKKRTEVRPTMSEVVEALEKALGYQQGTTRESFGLSLSSVYSYDVYVSFRVQRPEIGVVDRLYDVLEREGLSAYKDNFRNFDNELALLSTIKQLRSFIIVFSKDFAANSWNLYEVAAIIRCAKKKGRVVIPVFYGLFPSEVKEQKDSFNQVSIFDSDARIGEWRNALVEAASLPGIELHEFFHEGREDFANKAVEEIKDRLSRKGQTS